MDANLGEIGGGGIAEKRFAYSFGRDGARASEVVGGHGGVGGEDFGEGVADGGRVDFLGFGGSDFEERAVGGAFGYGLGKVDFGRGHVLGGKGEDFAFAATCEEEGCEEGGVHGGIDGGKKSVELFSCPKFHLGFGSATFGRWDVNKVVCCAVA